MGGRFVNPCDQFFDDNGDPLDGGFLYFSENAAPWSTNPQNVYAAADLTSPMTFVELDAAGRTGNIFASYEDTYRVVLKTSAGVTIWTRDDVQFLDVQELVALAEQLQEQIDNIELLVTNANPIRNPTTEVITADDSVTLTTAFLPHIAVGIDGRVAALVTAGTMQSGTLAGLGSTVRQAKMAGVSGDSSSIVEWRMRVSSAESRRFANLTCSTSALIRQESGLTASTTIAVYKADVADDFSAVTLVGSNSTNVTSSTNTRIEYAGLALGDVSNGIELVIRCQPGASFTTKDFYLTDIKIEAGAAATDFSPPSYPEMRAEAMEVGLGVYRDTGTANAIVISTRGAVSLYDGLKVAVLRTATSTGALTLAVDNNPATTVWVTDGSGCASGATVSGSVYYFRYNSTASRWILENPTVYPARAWVNFNGTGVVAIRASGNVSSITDNGTGDYTVNFATAFADANYGITTGATGDGGSNDGALTIKSGTPPTTSAARFLGVSFSGIAIDVEYANAAFFR